MKELFKLFVLSLFCFMISLAVMHARNPIIQTMYTADPAPMVYNDTLFVYTTHDEQTTSNFFTMYDWQLFSTTDMVNWTAHGAVASLEDFEWSDVDNGAWAPQCIERNGKFYFYCPIHGDGIGVLVADSPYGPFTDPLGERLIDSDHIWDDIDPTVFIDDDGQAYLYWGNPNLYYVKLNEDMISYDRSIGDDGIVAVEMTAEAFGEREDGEGEHRTNYEEGPWLYKRGDIYYMVYAAVEVPEYIAYSTAPTATGPWTYGGIIMDRHPDLAFTNHPGVIDYKGNSYLFYHNQALPGGGGFNRSVSVEQFEYNDDGTIPEIIPTQEGVTKSVANLNPYTRIEAETIAWSEGLEIESCSQKGIYVTNINDGDYIKIRDVDFGETGPGIFTANVSCDTRPGISTGGKIEIYINQLDGNLIGTVPVSYTGGWEEWMDRSTNVNETTGIHDVYLVFKGDASSDIFRFDYWKFEEKTTTQELVAINAMVDEYKLDTIAGYNNTAFQVNALFSDGTHKDITSEANLSFDMEDIVSITEGSVKGLNYGEVTVSIEYGGVTDNVKIIVKNLESELSVKELNSTSDNLELIIGQAYQVTITAVYYDDHTENVTDKADYTNTNPEVASIENGIISAESAGTTTITASFKGQLGEFKSTSIDVTVLNRSPYLRNQAEDFDEQSGIQVEACSDEGGGENIGFIENGDWIKFNTLDFDQGVSTFDARIASAASGGNIEIRTGDTAGELIGTCAVPGTGGWQSWRTVSCEVDAISGVHDIYLVFTGGGGFLFNMNWWKFYPEESPSTNVNEKSLINLFISQNDKCLKGLFPGDIVTIYNVNGQKIRFFEATAQQENLYGLSGTFIIEVKRDNQSAVIKAVL